MTNKMPVVGKRYKHKHAPNLIVKPSGIENGRVLFKEYSSIAVCRFFDFYEELPDSDHIPDIGKKVGEVLKDNLQEIEEAQVENPWICTSCGLSFDECSNKVSEKANLVDRALEEVKQVLNEWSEIICFNRDLALPAIKLLWPAVKNLVNALEAEKKINLPKEPNWVGVDLAKGQSWNNVSKPNTNSGYMFEIKFSEDGDKICATLPDFKNLQESPAGFGDDKEEALVGLIYDILKQKDKLSKELALARSVIEEASMLRYKRKVSGGYDWEETFDDVETILEKALKDMSKPEPKIDIKEERVKPESIKRESIWKSFSDDFLYNSGFTPEQILVFEVIFNSFEQMQKDIEELKKNNQ